MRFSALTALCAAQVALAGTLQAELVERAAGLLRRNGHGDGGKKAEVVQHNGGGGNVVIVSTQVIIIWVNNGGGAATQTVAPTQAAPAATHTVIVGGAGGLVYTPDSLSAAMGDMVIFEFQSQNHTVTQSPFDTPCKKMAEGMDSGFMPNPNNTVSPAPKMAMQVTTTKPLWFYCRQKSHCGKGMVFSINPTADKTQAMFQQMAIAQNGTGAAAPIVGGSAAPAPPASSTAAAAAPPASTVASVAPPAATDGMAVGSGTIGAGGSCSCSCLCGVAAFPNAAIQGLGSVGGFSGAIPMSALEA